MWLEMTVCACCGCRGMSDLGTIPDGFERFGPELVCIECWTWVVDIAHDLLDRTDACYEHGPEYYAQPTAVSKTVHDRARAAFLSVRSLAF